MPGVVLDGAQGEVVGDLCRRHAILHVLLVRKYQNGRFPQVLELGELGGGCRKGTENY